MTLAARIVLGAVLGCLAVLLLHPASRRFTRHPLFQSAEPLILQTDRAIRQNWVNLPDPSDMVDASLWMDVGTASLLRRKPVSRDQLLLLTEVSQAASANDPQNAFWPQCEAAFQLALHNTRAAEAAWIRASYLPKWDDLQRRRLLGLTNSLDMADRGNSAWHLAAALSEVSSEDAEELASAGSALLALGSNDQGVRAATILNGDLIEAGCPVGSGSAAGAALVDQAVSSDSERAAQGADQFDAKTGARLKSAINRAGGRPAHTSGDAEPAVDGAVLAVALPSAFAMAALACFGLFLLGNLLMWRPALQVALRPPWVILLSLAAGLLVYFETRLVFPTLWATICLASLVLEPKRVWDDGAKVWPSAFRAVTSCLGVAAALTMALALAQGSSAFLACSGLMSPSLVASLGHAAQAAFFCLSVGTAFCVLWAFQQQRQAPGVVAKGMSDLGLAGGIAGLVFLVVGTPIAMAADRQSASDLGDLMHNLPIVSRHQ